MLKDRSELEFFLTKLFTNNISSKVGITTRQEWCLELSEKYNIPIAMGSDYISRRKDLSECNEFVLFAITDVVKPDKIKKYYTPTEIKMYSGQKLELKKLKFPLRLKMIKIAEDQYIGKTSGQFLMQLREKQLINYNQETQRALRVQIRGGEKILRPFVDSKTVSNISEMFIDNTFISNVITLNINFDDEKADWYYDEKEMEFVVRNITAFDITDGYHRYLGMGRAYDKDNTWDYPMILQITAFSEGRARQMIWQENQKTLMTEADISVYNQNNSGNIITERMNKDSRFYLCGELSYKGLIDHILFTDTINRLWFGKDAPEKNTIVLTKELIYQINLVLEEKTELSEIPWQVQDIFIILYGIRYEHSTTEIIKALDKIPEEDVTICYKQNKINNKVLAVMKEVYGDD